MRPAWIELPGPRATNDEAAGHIRIGYTRASTARQALDASSLPQQDEHHPHLLREDLHPRLQAARAGKTVLLARELRAFRVRITLVVHEHKRRGRGIDLANPRRGDQGQPRGSGRKAQRRAGHPSLATIMRMLREHDEQQTAAMDT